MLDMVNDIVLSVVMAVAGGVITVRFLEDIIITIKSIVNKVKGK